MQRTDTCPTVLSDGRPQWQYDVEKSDTIPVTKTRAVAEEIEAPNTRMTNQDHNFDSEAITPDRSRERDESDTMYADAIRILSKS